MGNYHVPCGTGENLVIISNAYLLQTLAEEGTIRARIANLLKVTADPTHPKQVLVHYIIRMSGITMRLILQQVSDVVLSKSSFARLFFSF